MSSNKPRLCFIGFGEAGQAIASGLREAGVEHIAAWDILFPKNDGARLREVGETIGARLATSAADAVANSDIIVSAVAASLTNNYPTLDWQKVIDYNLERMASHGIRRAEEMEQVAATLREFGVAPLMTEAIVARQRQMGELGKQEPVRIAKREGGTAMLDAIEKASKP